MQIPSQRPIYPTPAGLVTTVDRDGKANIITLGEIYNLSIRKPVIVAGMSRRLLSSSAACGILLLILLSADETKGGEGRKVLQNFDYRGVRLDDGSLRRQFDEVRDFYLRIPNDDLLMHFTGLRPGRHEVKITVLPRPNPKSKENHVNLAGFEPIVGPQ